jgi:eukaryotic translation initiation factor 2-alpha kinase 4
VTSVENTLPLELLVVEFNARYYSTAQGRKKLKALADDVKRLASLRHTNLLAVLASKLVLPNTSAAPKLYILHERRPSLTLQDVLEDCSSLREDRASVRATAIIHVALPVTMLSCRTTSRRFCPR